MQAAAAKGGSGGRGGASPEAQALARWNRLGKKARAALRKANMHAVLALEAQVGAQLAVACAQHAWLQATRSIAPHGAPTVPLDLIYTPCFVRCFTQLLQYLEDCAEPVPPARSESGTGSASPSAENSTSAPQCEALLLGGLDGWGRLLVHGLADYYGLASSTRSAAGVGSGVVVWPGHVESSSEEGQQGDGVLVAVCTHTNKVGL